MKPLQYQVQLIDTIQEPPIIEQNLRSCNFSPGKVERGIRGRSKQFLRKYSIVAKRSILKPFVVMCGNLFAKNRSTSLLLTNQPKCRGLSVVNIFAVGLKGV
jgi:hypothetical protein